MKRNAVPIQLRLAALGMIMLVFALVLPFYPVLAFEYEDTGTVMAFFPIGDGSAFEIKYIHSIHLSPVHESYFVQGRNIVQDQLTFEEYGIGMPSNAEGNERFFERDGKYVISGLNRSYRQVDIRVARVTESQELLFQGETIPFTAFAKRGAWIRMKVSTINMWRLLTGGSTHDPR